MTTHVDHYRCAWRSSSVPIISSKNSTTPCNAKARDVVHVPTFNSRNYCSHRHLNCTAEQELGAGCRQKLTILELMHGPIAILIWVILHCITAINSLENTMFSLPDNYSKLEPPLGPNGEPVNVQLSMHIMDIVLDEKAQTVKFDSYFRTFWEENRFIIENMTRPFVRMDTEATAKLWLPDIFALFVQEVEKPEFIAPAAGVHFYQNKTIFRSSLYLTTVRCNLIYFNYPMDSQTCTVKIQSYIYSIDTIQLAWHPKGISQEEIVMPSFYLEGIRTTPSVISSTLVDSYSEVTFEMRFKRKLRFSILAVYVPSLLVVIVSWLSLWVPPEMVPGRMVLVITTLLTLTALFSANLQGMPEVSYVKAIDVWTLACIVFVFATILEYIVVLRLSQHKNVAAVAPKQRTKVTKGNWTVTGAEKAVRLERFSRVASVVAFAIFNVIYWAYYLGQ